MAKKGELRLPLPVGYCYDSERQTTVDEDEQVRNVITLLFKVFKNTGTAYKVSHYFHQNKLKFPKRAYGGIWKGKLIWGNLTHSRVLGVLKNPCYAGVYVFGRYRYDKHIDSNGNIKLKCRKLPIEDWKFTIKEHHQAYISWEEYLENQKTLRDNQANLEKNRVPGAAREGLALLQGLLICGYCGRRITIRYTGNKGIYPCYQCNGKKNDGMATNHCLSVHSNLIDQSIVQRVFEVIKPAQIDIAIKSFEEIEIRKKAIEKQWKMKLERAEYESQLAQRRYEEVDPSNRLVVATLEKRWNATLTEFENINAQYIEYQKKESIQETIRCKNSILSIAQNFSKLWNAKTTTYSDKKRILRLLIKDIVVTVSKENRESVIHVRWHGGALEEIIVTLPSKSCDKWRHPKSIVNEVKELADKLTDIEIATELNKKGLKTNKGNYFTIDSIKWIRYKHRIPSPRLGRVGELTIREVMKKFDVSYHVVYYWIENNIITTRRVDGSRKLWITIDSAKEHELQKWVENSTRIAKVRTMNSQNKIVGGAL